MAPKRRLAADDEAFADLQQDDDNEEGGDRHVVEGEPEDDDDIADDDIDVEEEPAPLDADPDPDAPTDDEDEGDDDDVDVPAAPVADAGTGFDPKDVRILALEANNLEIRKGNVTAAEARAKADIEAAKTEMEAAQEAGNTKANIQATEKYTQANIALQNAVGHLDQIKMEEGNLVRRAQQLQAAAPKDAEGKPILTGEPATARRAAVTPAASKHLPTFRKANTWFGDPKYKKQTEAILRIDRGLNAEGKIDKNKKAYFVELGIRMNREFPGLYKNLDGKPIATGKRERGAGPGVPGGAGGSVGTARTANPNKLKLESADLQQMRVFGFDPDNKAHRKEWLITKRQLAAQGG